ncbi:MAG: hypothetical protein HGA90_05440 [Alphaproteobacteria bacterium]|nr:hypothetical protein [Alphaproteobacteria bacterium]
MSETRQKILPFLFALLTGVALCAPAQAEEATVLKYSGGKLVYAGLAQDVQFLQGQGILSFDSQTFGFKDKCTGLIVRLINDVVILQNKKPVNCDDLPQVQK